jgi:hypothetical protein
MRSQRLKLKNFQSRENLNELRKGTKNMQLQITKER